MARPIADEAEHRFTIFLTESLRADLEAAARRASRSTVREIVWRLQTSLQADVQPKRGRPVGRSPR
jgi:hypothetical protein